MRLSELAGCFTDWMTSQVAVSRELSSAGACWHSSESLLWSSIPSDLPSHRDCTPRSCTLRAHASALISSDPSQRATAREGHLIGRTGFAENCSGSGSISAVGRYFLVAEESARGCYWSRPSVPCSAGLSSSYWVLASRPSDPPNRAALLISVSSTSASDGWGKSDYPLLPSNERRSEILDPLNFNSAEDQLGVESSRRQFHLEGCDLNSYFDFK